MTGQLDTIYKMFESWNEAGNVAKTNPVYVTSMILIGIIVIAAMPNLIYQIKLRMMKYEKNQTK